MKTYTKNCKAKANFFQESPFFHTPIFLPEHLLSSQGDERKNKYLLETIWLLSN